MGHLIPLVLVALTVLFVPFARAHSWLDCSNWKLSNPAGYTSVSAQRFSDADGTCLGWARRFSIGQRPFGGNDAIQFFRHYVQPVGPTVKACRWTDGTTGSSGSNEGAATPRSLAYTPNRDPYNQFTYGRMAQVQSGETICWRWPAKNHQAHVNVATNMVHVNWDDVPNRAAGTELTWNQLRTKRVASMPFGNCPVPGVPSAGDSSGTGSDFKPCGGCFTVPTRNPGVYTVQWDWPFKDGDSETYTSCADIEVIAGGTSGGGTGGGGTTLPNVNCVVSAWSAFGACSGNCGGGTQTRTRTVTTAQSGTGTACPALTSSQTCNTAACVGDISQHVVYDDTLHDFVSWSWATSFSLTSSSVVHSGTRSISWTPQGYDAVFLHYNVVGDLADYRSISFWINGGSAGRQSVRFAMVKSGAQSVPLFSWQVPAASIRRNQWSLVSLTFSTIGKSSGAFDGLWFQGGTSARQSTVYIDDINFMHTHATTARLDSEFIDPCLNIPCPANAKCIGGSCTCAAGFDFDENLECTVPPTISNVQVKTYLGEEVTELGMMDDEMYAVTWNTTGSCDTVSIVLIDNSDGSIQSIAGHISNSGEYLWEVAPGLANGTYTLRVVYSAAVYGESETLTNSGGEVEQCAVPECNGHGECDSDTSFLCQCRCGWSGDACATEPDGVVHHRSVIRALQAASVYAADPEEFESLFRNDLSTALGVASDQIEVVSVTAEGDHSVIAFDLLLGAMFEESSFFTNSTTDDAINAQLASEDSALNRGIFQYELTRSESTSSSSSSSGSSEPQLSAASPTFIFDRPSRMVMLLSLLCASALLIMLTINH
jgi:hypothetical protein